MINHCGKWQQKKGTQLILKYNIKYKMQRCGFNVLMKVLFMFVWLFSKNVRQNFSFLPYPNIKLQNNNNNNNN